MKATRASNKIHPVKPRKAGTRLVGLFNGVKTLKVRTPRKFLAAYRAVPMTRIITPPGRLLRQQQGVSERVLAAICAVAFVVGFLGVGVFHIVDRRVAKQIHHADTSVGTDTIASSGDTTSSAV